MVKGRNDRINQGARSLEAQHILEVDATQWRVPDGEDQFAALLQADVRRSLDKCGGYSVGDLSQASRCARDDDHPVHRIRPAGNAGSDIRIEKVDGLPGGLPQEPRGDLGAL